jgi:hypothetical protein
MFSINETTQSQFKKEREEMTAKLKGKPCHVNSTGKWIYRKRKFNDDRFVIVKYNLSETKHFGCGIIDAHYVIKSLDRKYITEMQVEAITIYQ